MQPNTKVEQPAMLAQLAFAPGGSPGRFSVTLLDDVRPANGHEDIPSAALLLQLKPLFPDLCVDAVAGDAGFGFEIYLAVYADLHARRVIDRRAHQTDKDKDQWATRGYDDYGRPVCQYGYVFGPLMALTKNATVIGGAAIKLVYRVNLPASSSPKFLAPPSECPALGGL
jgi:hypothetical protein